MKRRIPVSRRSVRQSRLGLNDRLWARLILLRAGGRCERCGATERVLQAAHLFSRAIKTTRWDPDNGTCLCAGCHRFWAHVKPDEFHEWAREKLGAERYERLRLRVRTPGKPDVAGWRLLLQEELRKMEGAEVRS